MGSGRRHPYRDETPDSITRLLAEWKRHGLSTALDDPRAFAARAEIRSRAVSPGRRSAR